MIILLMGQEYLLRKRGTTPVTTIYFLTLPQHLCVMPGSLAIVMTMHERTRWRERQLNNHSFTRCSSLQMSSMCSCLSATSYSNLNAQVPVGATIHLIQNVFLQYISYQFKPSMSFHSFTGAILLFQCCTSHTVLPVSLISCSPSTSLLPHLALQGYHLHLHVTNCQYSSYASILFSQSTIVPIRRVLLFQTLFFIFI